MVVQEFYNIFIKNNLSGTVELVDHYSIDREFFGYKIRGCPR